MNAFLTTIGVIAAVILIILGILMPVFVYTGQKWAYRCFQELVKVNKRLDAIEQNTLAAAKFFDAKLDQARLKSTPVRKPL